MESINILSQSSAISLIFFLSIIFVVIGIYYSKKYKGLNNYLVANRDIGTFSLTTSLVSSALGAWILFGPASAATWGGIGAIMGYSLGAAFPLFILIFLGQRFRKLFPKAKTLIEVIRIKFGKKLFKLILFLSIFYMLIFLIAEVTAVSILINYISGTSLWITALIVILSSLIYTLYGGLRASIFTDNIQFIIFIILLLISFSYLISFNSEQFNFDFILLNKPMLLSSDYLPNLTAGLTFFIAVAATNLFHQGNWQRVFAAKNYEVLKKSLKLSFFIIVPIVFFMGITGIIAISYNKDVSPDLAFFSILLNDKSEILSIGIIILAISLTVSTVDTLLNAISSLIVVDGKKIKKNLKFANTIVILLSIVAIFVASKGFSILYLFLLADLLCCAAVFTVFYGFYKKKFNERNAIKSILLGLFLGLLIFPSPDFSKSLLIGTLLPIDLFPQIVSSSLLFWSFLLATLGPAIVIMTYDSFKR